MNDSLKIKLLASTSLVLILLNLVAIGFMWLGPHHPPRPGMGRPGYGPDRNEAIIRELNLNDTQRKQFEQLKDEHHHIIEAINEKDRRTHEALFDLIKTGGENTATADSLINEMADNKKQIETATYHHLADLRKMCTPDQQKKFDDIVVNLFKQGPQGPPPPPRP